MKHHIRTLACGAALLAAITVVACGGKQTMASKSASAYDEAKKKGIPSEAGEHGGHSAEPAGAATTGAETAPMAGMDHSAMASMNHSKIPGMKHATAGSGAHDMAGMDHSSMAGMDHAKMPGMQHGATAAGSNDMAGMSHPAMPGMQHGSMPGMQHGGTTGAMPGMQHGTQPSAPIVIPPPTSNAAIARTQPAATLRPDEFDAPAPAAIDEAAKTALGMSHSMDKMTPNPPAPAQHEHPPQPKPKPPSEHHHSGTGETS